MQVHIHRVRRACGALAVIALFGTLGWVSPAAASNAGGTEQISGVGVGTPSCDGQTSDFTMAMSGSLDGCWYTDVLEVAQETSSGIYRERGTETFVGCLTGADGVAIDCGSFTTTYQFTAKFAPDGSEIHGRCQHPIVSGTGDFAGLTGRVDFKDDVETGEFLYRGHIDLA